MAAPDTVTAVDGGGGPGAPPPPPATPPAGRGSARMARRVLGLLLGVLVLALVAAGGGALWLWHSDTGLQRALQRVPGLSVQGAQGRPTGGPYAVQRLQWQGAGLRVVIDGLAWDDAQWRWLPHPGAWFGLSLQRPRAARVLVQRTPDAAPAGPSAPPQSLRLPFELQAPGLRVGSLIVDTQAPVTDIGADLHLGAAAGAEHRVMQLGATRGGLALQGQATVGTDGELPLQARIQLTTRPGTAPADTAWQAEAQARGPLQRLAVDAQLRLATGPAATAQATLAPLAAWPLLALAAQTRDLDLSVLSPALPRTRLSGHARLAEPGRSAADVLALDLDLANAEPGPWDASRLPLTRLQLRLQGRPDAPGTLVFEQLQVQLAGAAGAAAGDAATAGRAAPRGPAARAAPAARGGSAAPPAPDATPAQGRPAPPAGELQGTGRWQGATLSLQLALRGVQPAALHTALPPMTLDGPVTLAFDGLPSPAGPGPATGAAGAAAAARAAGPRGELVVDLTGRLPRRGAPPLALQAEAQWAAPRDGSLQLTLRRASARAGAAATATATASAERNTAGLWRLQTRGDLQRFDPGPWWPAAAPGPGPHRLNGGWVADLSWPSPPSPPSSPAPAAQPAPPAPARSAARPAAPGPYPAGLPPGLRGSARLTLDDSRWAGLAWRGQAALQAGELALLWDADLRAGANRLQTRGRVPADRAAASSLVLGLQAPALAALAPLAGLLPRGMQDWWPREGALTLDATALGRWPAVRSEGRLSAQGLRSAVASLGAADATWNLSTQGEDAPLSLQLQATDLAHQAQRLEQLQATLQGSLREHTLDVQARSPLRPPAWAEAAAAAAGTGAASPAVPGSQMRLQASGRWALAGPSAGQRPASPAAGTAAASPAWGTWRGRIAQLQAAPRTAPGAPWLSSQDLDLTLTLDAAGQPLQARLAPGRVQALGGALRWQQAQWQAGPPGGAARWQLQAELEPMPVAPWLARWQPRFGWQGDLALAGTLRLSRGERFEAEGVIQRQGGDLSLTVEGARRALELSDVRLGLVATQGRWQFTQALVGRSVGVVGGLQTIDSTPQAAWPDDSAPLSGGLSLIVPQLGVWAPWLPPGWRLGGDLRIAASFGGRVGAPEYRGDITGGNLAVRNLFEGIHLQQGELAVALAGTQATVQRFVFRDGAGGGELRVSGGAVFGDEPRARLRAVAAKLRAVDRFDRRIAVSGAADLDLQATRLAMDGSFTVDEGLVDATQADAPALGNDVVVLNRAPLVIPGAIAPSAPAAAPAPGAPQTTAVATAVDLRIDLGEALRLRGRGLDTLLRGQLRVTTPGGQLAVNGVVRAEQGSYTAYGQNLRIERGTLVFRGEVGNPQLDILAVRADIDTRVGVLVSGSATNPRVRLYSEPELGELDTLTWLVLGREPTGLGRDDTALLQRAALALLAGERGGGPGLVQRLGLDELSLSRGNGSGSGTGTGDTIVSLGKQISRRVYVGYAHALGTAGGTWELIYRVAGRLTLRARSGAENAIDAIWTWRW